MLKIQPIITKSNNVQIGVQYSAPRFLSYSSPIKSPLGKDVFTKSARLDKQTQVETLSDKLTNISFEGKKKNKYEQGQEIATNLKEIFKSNFGAVSTNAFKKEYAKIDNKNVIPTIKAYNKISPKMSLIGAICSEVADYPETRIKAVNGIIDRLVSNGKIVGVQTEHYKTRFDEELQDQFDTVLLPVKAKHLNKITNAFVQAIENKSNLTAEERADIKKADIKTTQTYTTKILSTTAKKAEKSLQAQQEYDGWSAKLGEQIKKLWKSENQAHLVKEDIDTFKGQVGELNKLVGTKDYNKKFKEIFNIEYDPELIATYKDKEEKFVAASLIATVENNFKSAVPDLLNKKPLTDKLSSPYTASAPIVVESRQEMYERNLNAFANFVGKGNVEKGKAEIQKTMKDYKITPKSTLNDKYDVLQRMANRYEKRLHQNTRNALGKKSLMEMKNEYENSYYAAFGVDNDIAKRVEDYRASQKWSELLVQDTILCSASIPIWLMTAGTGVIPTLKIAAMHSAADLAVYGSDRLSSKQGMTQKELKETLKWTAIDGTTAIVNQLCYKSIEALVSPIAKMSGKAAKVSEMALTGMADVAVDCGMEYLGSGKVTLQGTVYSVIFTATGQIVDMKVEDSSRKVL